MFYIHDSSCISHQPTFNEVDLETIRPSVNNLIHAIEPKYENIPLGQLRRMGRALRMGVGTGMKLLANHKVDGILIATANGGIEDSIMFLNQIMEYDEGRLTPTHFVQSTYNAIAGILGMITKNNGYNATHVHRGISFENTALDAAMLLRENPLHQYLIGGVDEISERNHRLVSLAGWYRCDTTLNTELFHTNAPGTLPGEGAAMFLVNNIREGAKARLHAIGMINTLDENHFQSKFKDFLETHCADGKPVDLLLTGENGDNRLLKYYTAAEQVMENQIPVARFKHITGEFQTVPALALWIACHLLQTQQLPVHMIKKTGQGYSLRRILICNNYQGAQHGLMVVDAV